MSFCYGQLKSQKLKNFHKINQHIFQRSQKIDVSVRRVKENQTHRGRPPRGAEGGPLVSSFEVIKKYQTEIWGVPPTHTMVWGVQLHLLTSGNIENE